MGPLLDGQPRYRYHFFITDRQGDLLHLERDHRRHAQVARERSGISNTGWV